MIKILFSILLLLPLYSLAEEQVFIKQINQDNSASTSNSNGDSDSYATMFNKIEALNSQNQKLNDRLDILLKNQKDLEKRLSDLEKALGSLATNQVDRGKDSFLAKARLYYRYMNNTNKNARLPSELVLSYNKLILGNISGAESGFLKYKDKKPNAANLATTYYWLGNIYFYYGDNKNVIKNIGSYYKLAKNNDGRLPDALWMMAVAFSNLKDSKGVCATTDRLMSIKNLSAEVLDKAISLIAENGCRLVIRVSE